MAKKVKKKQKPLKASLSGMIKIFYSENTMKKEFILKAIAPDLGLGFYNSRPWVDITVSFFQ